MKFNNRNVFISPRAHIGENVRIGDNTTIYDNVVVEDNVTICNDCVIGEPLSSYYDDPDSYDNPETRIGAQSLIRSHVLIYAGCRFGIGFSTGHRVTIRSETHFGHHCRVGTLSDIQGECQFGDHCWLHSSVHVGQTTKVGNFVFLYPFVVTTNDPTPPSDVIRGPILEDFVQVGVQSVIMPGIRLGQHSLIGASSIVTKDTEAYGAYHGAPAKRVKDVREIRDRVTGEPHYPWPYRFDRGMPWAGQDFDTWLSNSDYSENELLS